MPDDATDGDFTAELPPPRDEGPAPARRPRSLLVAACAALGVVVAGGLGLAVVPRAGTAGFGGHDHGQAAANGSYWASVGGGGDDRGGGRTRTYYIGADEVVWDYAPRYEVD